MNYDENCIMSYQKRAILKAKKSVQLRVRKYALYGF